MTEQKMEQLKSFRLRRKRTIHIIIVELIIISMLGISYWVLHSMGFIAVSGYQRDADTSMEDNDDTEEDYTGTGETDAGNNLPTPEEQALLKEKERLQQQEQERLELIAEAEYMAKGYYYDSAIELIKSYEGPEGSSYEAYIPLVTEVRKLEEEKDQLVLYGGEYDSVTQINHIFFHSLIAEPEKAFDGDYDSKGYNMYMVTVGEFDTMIQKLYDDGYVLVNMSDIAQQITTDDGKEKYVPGEIWLLPGKKPLVLSVDDVSYYEYMDNDGFPSRIIIGADGKPTCEMLQEDGSTTVGAYDVVPILDAFVEEHPDFSYKGAKGLLALTGYQGVLGYRTNDTASATYEEDKAAAITVAEALKAEGWEFASHSWGHKNVQKQSLAAFRQDTERWLSEVGPLIGPTPFYVFPFGVDIETTVGHYKSEKYEFLKENGFHFFMGVYKEPWMQIRDDYVRMTRRAVDGQALLQFPERLADLFDIKETIDPGRPPRNW